MRLEAVVAKAINERCWAIARRDLRWRIWADVDRRMRRLPHAERPFWYLDFSSTVALQYLSGVWPPYNGWYRR